MLRCATPLRVTLAYDGREALETLQREHDIGLVLLDLMMPHLSGLDVLAAMRADDRLRSVPCDGHRLSALAFSPDGAFVACGSGTIDGEGARGTIEIREAGSGAFIRILEDPFIGFPAAFAFSPDGASLASGEWSCYRGRGGAWWEFSEARVFDASDWNHVKELNRKALGDMRSPAGPTRAFNVAFSPDGKTLAVGAGKGSACLWAWEGDIDFQWLPPRAEP